MLGSEGSREPSYNAGLSFFGLPLGMVGAAGYCYESCYGQLRHWTHVGLLVEEQTLQDNMFG
jgi:hypothetical protein